MSEKMLTTDQVNLALTLAERHELNIPFDTLCEYEFGKKFIDLFVWDADHGETTGHRRVNTIINYLYYDKDQRHLQFKLDLSDQDVAFMVSVLAKYRFDGMFPRENLKDPDPEATVFAELEDQLLEQSYLI